MTWVSWFLCALAGWHIWRTHKWKLRAEEWERIVKKQAGKLEQAEIDRDQARAEQQAHYRALAGAHRISMFFVGPDKPLTQRAVREALDTHVCDVALVFGVREGQPVMLIPNSREERSETLGIAVVDLMTVRADGPTDFIWDDENNYLGCVAYPGTEIALFQDAPTGERQSTNVVSLHRRRNRFHLEDQ